MRIFLKILAFTVLIATAGAASFGVYAWMNRFPVCSFGTVQIIPAAEQESLLNNWIQEAEKNTFPGTVCYEGQQAPGTPDSRFVQYTIRLSNKGFFPAEWISVGTSPAEGDQMIQEAGGANVLNAGEDGDLSLLVLQSSAGQSDRELQLTCYVLGEKHTVILLADENGIREKEE